MRKLGPKLGRGVCSGRRRSCRPLVPRGSAVELPAFARMAQLLQRHARHGYPHLSAEQLRSRLPASSASAQGDGFAAAYGHVHDLDLAALTSEETTELH